MSIHLVTLLASHFVLLLLRSLLLLETNPKRFCQSTIHHQQIQLILYHLR